MSSGYKGKSVAGKLVRIMAMDKIETEFKMLYQRAKRITQIGHSGFTHAKYPNHQVISSDRQLVEPIDRSSPQGVSV